VQSLCRHLISGFALLTAIVVPMPADCPTGTDAGDWYHASGIEIPTANAYGQEQTPGKEALYACRAEWSGGCHIGKIRTGFNGCHIPYGGKEYEVRAYDLLRNKLNWITMDMETYRRKALSFHPGREANGKALDMCRATYPAGTWGVHIGKIRSEFSGCNIPWGGQEITVSRFDVADFPH
jgi:hypothetical protein